MASLQKKAGVHDVSEDPGGKGPGSIIPTPLSWTLCKDTGSEGDSVSLTLGAGAASGAAGTLAVCSSWQGKLLPAQSVWWKCKPAGAEGSHKSIYSSVKVLSTPWWL